MSSLPSSSRPRRHLIRRLSVSGAVPFCSSLVVSFRPRPVLRLVHRPACCRLVLRSVPRSVPRSSVVSSVSSSHSSFLAVLPPRAPFCSARRSAFRSSFRRRLVPRLVSSFRRRRSVLRLVPSSRSSSVGSSSLPVSSTREAGRFLFSFDGGRASKQGSGQTAGGRWIGQGGESEGHSDWAFMRLGVGKQAGGAWAADMRTPRSSYSTGGA